MNQPIFRSLVIRSLMIMALGTTLFSFSRIAGMESFKVYLNNKLLLQQYAAPDATLQSLNLNGASGNDMLNIYYDHCGRIGTKRVITLTDPQNNVLKEWHFPDAPQGAKSSAMSCRVDDIRTFQKASSTLHVVYSSRELPKGKVLAALVTEGSEVKASR